MDRASRGKLYAFGTIVQTVQKVFRPQRKRGSPYPNTSKTHSSSRSRVKKKRNKQTDTSRIYSNLRSGTNRKKNQQTSSGNESNRSRMADDGKWQEWPFSDFPISTFVFQENKPMVNAIVSSWNALLKKNIKSDETYEKRLEKLKDDPSELNHTQPFVNGVLRAFFKVYLNERAVRTPNVLSESDSLYLFCGKKVDDEDEARPTAEEKSFLIQGCKRGERVPDAAFFRRGTPVADKDDVSFDKTAQDLGLLVSVGAKRNLKDNGMTTAIFECQRDHAHVSRRSPSKSMQVGFSIITDGVGWYFLYICWKHEGGFPGNWKQSINLSKQIDFATETGKSELANWLLFILDLSLTGPKLSTDFATMKIEGLSLTKILHCGDRSDVSLWKYDSGKFYVLKYFFPSTNWIGNKIDNEKRMEYCLREFKYLKELESNKSQNIAKLLSTSEETVRLDRGFWLHYGGISLEKLDICGKRGQELAVIVKRDIWGSALPSLSDPKTCICHGDIHQSNVLICLETKVATLIDFEGAKKFGASLEDSPIRHRFHGKKEADEEVDKICVAALLGYLWDPLTTNFEGLTEYMIELKSITDLSHRYSLVDEIPDSATRDGVDNIIEG